MQASRGLCVLTRSSACYSSSSSLPLSEQLLTACRTACFTTCSSTLSATFCVHTQATSEREN